jgi:hypothetical protein
MGNLIAFIGILVLVLGSVFIGVSRISDEKGYWYHGDGSASYNTDSSMIFFEKDDRWTIENVSYLMWIGGINQSVSRPTDNLQVSLYDGNGNRVTQVSYSDLKQMPIGLPVPNTGMYTIKIENIGASYTVSATFVRWVFKNETVFPYNYLFPVGILVLLGGAGTAAYGAVKRSRLRAGRKATRKKSA